MQTCLLVGVMMLVSGSVSDVKISGKNNSFTVYYTKAKNR